MIFTFIYTLIIESCRSRTLSKRIANDGDLMKFGIKVDGEYPHKQVPDIKYSANEGDVYWAVRDY